MQADGERGVARLHVCVPKHQTPNTRACTHSARDRPADLDSGEPVPRTLEARGIRDGVYKDIGTPRPPIQHRERVKEWVETNRPAAQMEQLRTPGAKRLSRKLTLVCMHEAVSHGTSHVTYFRGACTAKMGVQCRKHGDRGQQPEKCLMIKTLHNNCCICIIRISGAASIRSKIIQSHAGAVSARRFYRAKRETEGGRRPLDVVDLGHYCCKSCRILKPNERLESQTDAPATYVGSSSPQHVCLPRLPTTCLERAQLPGTRYVLPITLVGARDGHSGSRVSL